MNAEHIRNTIAFNLASGLIKHMFSLMLFITLSLPAIAAPERQIQLDSQSDFRDIGGYQTTDERFVNWGEVYRSGELYKVSDADVGKLQELEIRTVADRDDHLGPQHHCMTVLRPRSVSS